MRPEGLTEADCLVRVGWKMDCEALSGALACPLLAGALWSADAVALCAGCEGVLFALSASKAVKSSGACGAAVA